MTLQSFACGQVEKLGRLILMMTPLRCSRISQQRRERWYRASRLLSTLNPIFHFLIHFFIPDSGQVQFSKWSSVLEVQVPVIYRRFGLMSSFWGSEQSAISCFLLGHKKTGERCIASGSTHCLDHLTAEMSSRPVCWPRRPRFAFLSHSQELLLSWSPPRALTVSLSNRLVIESETLSGSVFLTPPSEETLGCSSRSSTMCHWQLVRSVALITFRSHLYCSIVCYYHGF